VNTKETEELKSPDLKLLAQYGISLSLDEKDSILYQYVEEIGFTDICIRSRALVKKFNGIPPRDYAGLEKLKKALGSSPCSEGDDFISPSDSIFLFYNRNSDEDIRNFRAYYLGSEENATYKHILSDSMYTSTKKATLRGLEGELFTLYIENKKLLYYEFCACSPLE